MRFRQGLFLIFMVVALGAMSFAGQSTVAAERVHERPKIPVELYGNIFSVEPVEIPGAMLSYRHVKSYIPRVLVSMHDPDKGRDFFATVAHLEDMLAAYQKTYEMAVPILAKRLHSYAPDRTVFALEYEVTDYLRVGRWRELSNKYKKYSKSLAPQILDAQKVHNKYLALLYLTEMVRYSPEAAGYTDKEPRDYGFDARAKQANRYANGYGYGRLYPHE